MTKAKENKSLKEEEEEEDEIQKAENESLAQAEQELKTKVKREMIKDVLGKIVLGFEIVMVIAIIGIGVSLTLVIVEVALFESKTGTVTGAIDIALSILPTITALTLAAIWYYNYYQTRNHEKLEEKLDRIEAMLTDIKYTKHDE